MNSSAIFPPPLRAGDKIAIIAPASSPKKAAVETAVEALREVDYLVDIQRDLSQSTGYLAGEDAVRLAEINQAFRDPSIRAVLTSRGGYGVARIIDKIDFAALQADPKIVVGFSDITALHCGICAKTNVVTYHGPNAIDGLRQKDNPSTRASLMRVLTKSHTTPWEYASLPNHKDALQALSFSKGKAQGRLVGGNLSVLCALLGTPYAIDATDSILFIEDVNEAPYRIDRMFAQLELSGVLKAANGFVLGYFTNCVDDDSEEQHHAAALVPILERYLKPLGTPVLTGFPAGHGDPNLAIPLNAICEIDADEGRWRTLNVSAQSRD